MKLKKDTIQELVEILKEEFNCELGQKEMENFAYSLVGYFDLLLKINNRLEVRKSSSQPH